MKIKTREELIKAYVDFFREKGHKEIPSASLIPENDPTVLFTTAGMHPLVPYLSGRKHPVGKKLVNVQKCVRMGDINMVGNETHHTFFEMLGNWSLGDYWKKEAIEYSFEFLTEVLGFEKEKLAVSCFAGDDDAPRDLESAQAWMDLGIVEERIAFLGKGDNWWGPAGKTGPCGPDSEMFYWVSEEEVPEKFDVKDKRWVEIWNDVFMQYNKTEDGSYEPLVQKNVDTGMGVERTVAVLNGLSDNYESSTFKPLIDKIGELSGKSYSGEGNINKSGISAGGFGDDEAGVEGERVGEDKRAMRIVADHVRAAVFILGDERGIKPSNLGQGYVLRRLIRRAVRYGKVLGIEENFIGKIAEVVLQEYEDYSELEENREFILKELEEEEGKFRLTLEKGLKKFNDFIKYPNKLSESTKRMIGLKNGVSQSSSEFQKNDCGKLGGKDAFLLFQSYGFPIEMTVELAKERSIDIDIDGFKEEEKRHRELSRTSSAGQFKSGLADDSEMTTRLHTANHLLLAVLRKVLKADVRQKGANINSERLRFDFSFDRKLTDGEVKEVENLVNEKIEAGLEVVRDEMTFEEAVNSGAHGEFGTKYPDVVSVYAIMDSSEEKGWISKEICTGPHVSNTKEIGKFKILKEISSSSGVRRIKAVVG